MCALALILMVRFKGCQEFIESGDWPRLEGRSVQLKLGAQGICEGGFPILPVDRMR